MLQFLMKRLVGLIFVVLGVTFITFIIGYLSPDDPITQLLGQRFNQQAYEQLRHVYGLDLPWYQQYWNFLTNLFRFDFGYSFQYRNRPVIDILSSGIPISLELGLWALLLQLLLGIPIGIFTALKARTWIDTSNTIVILIIYALPIFVFGVLIQIGIVVFDQVTGAGWPVSGWGRPWRYDWSDIQYKLVPILVYAAAGFAYFSRLTRTSMLEVFEQDYIRTARAKGLSERSITYRHALRNALIPLITVLGASFGLLVGGAFFIERIFNIPGIAEITLTSIDTSDYPVIQATTVILAIAVVLGNLISDILYSVADPRIRIE